MANSGTNGVEGVIKGVPMRINSVHCFSFICSFSRGIAEYHMERERAHSEGSTVVECESKCDCVQAEDALPYSVA